MNRRNMKKITTRYHRLVVMIALTLTVLLIGIAGFMYFEHFTLFDAIWVMIISVMTIGYGDIYPVTEQGRLFALFLVPAGAGVISYGLGSVASYFLEKHFPEKVWEKRMQRELKRLNDHVIICGSGRIAVQVYKQLLAEQEEMAILFISEQGEELSETLGPETMKLVADPTDSTVLQKARLQNARALVAAMEQDSENVFITLTAKNLNDSLEVSAVATKEDSEAVLKRAGADYVINPAVIGGRELAMSVIRPSGAAYVSQLMSTQSKEFSVGELKIDRDSPFNGQSLSGLNLYEETGVLPVAVSRNGELVSNPDGSLKLTDSDVLLILGRREDIEQAEKRHMDR